MLDYTGLHSELSSSGMSSWSNSLTRQVDRYFNTVNHGDFKQWQQAIIDLPHVIPGSYDFSENAPRIGTERDISDNELKSLNKSLKILMPWRKGPFNLFGVEVDAEWRSDLKWSRIQDSVSCKDKTILDVGCGNGYYALRMLGSGARLVIGIDPTLRFIMQFEVFKHFVPDMPAYILPFAIQDVETGLLNFDMVLSMGVIYHRRDPDQHLKQLFDCLKNGGELILESLIIEPKAGDVLVPDGRYAKMNNVWWIPTTQTLIERLNKLGFENIDVINESVTSTREQRVTDWMTFESLNHFLDPDDQTKTIEGYPAPRRAILYATKPN